MESTLEQQLHRHLAGLKAAGVEFVRAAPAPPAGFFTPGEGEAPATGAGERQPLAVLAGDYDACTRCTSIASTRLGTVPGCGPIGAKLFVLADAPLADDVKAKEPFAGALGETLTKMLKAIGIDRGTEAYLSTALRCRPAGDRKPTEKETANCRAFLERELKIVQPKFILCLGEAAGQSLLQEQVPLAKLRATIHEVKGIKAVCTHHPAAFGANPRAKSEAWADLQLLRAQWSGEDSRGQGSGVRGQ
jgi:DNA polymerase